MVKKKSKVIVQHAKNCCVKNENNPWSGIPDGFFFGNWNATENVIGDYHVWIRVKCNDPSCNGIKAVHSSVLKEA